MKKTHYQDKASGKWLLTLLLTLLWSVASTAQTTVSINNADGEHIYHLRNGNYLNISGTDASYVTIAGYMTHSNGSTFQWTGRDGSYAFKTHTAAQRGLNYIEIIPLSNSSTAISNAAQGGYATDANNTTINGEPVFWNLYIPNGDRVDYFNPNASGDYGSIWIGSGDFFGFPEYGHGLEGWGHGTQYYGLNTTVLAHPNNTKQYYFDIKIGKEYKYGEDFAIKFFQRKNYESSYDPEYSNTSYRRIFEFVYRDRSSGEPDHSYDSYSTLIRFRPKTAANGDEVMDYLQINAGDNYYTGDGNIEGLSNLLYSEMPKLPKWYSFNFMINFDDLSTPYVDNVAWSSHRAPLDVTLTSRPTEGTDDIEWATGMKNEANFETTSVRGNNLDISVQLNNRPDLEGSKRIYLRDALRFDQCILYANQGLDNDACFYKKLTITGELNSQDMQFLSAILKRNRIETLDLSQAKIPNNAIPANWAEGCTSLKAIHLPEALTSIGNNAFKNCTELEEIDFEGTTTALTYLGSSAFENCGKLTNEPIDNVVSTLHCAISNAAFRGCDNEGFTTLNIPNTVPSIDQYAFAGDKYLTQVTVPASVSQTSSEIISSVNSSEVGEVYTTTTYTIPNATPLYARDFNSGKGTGWNWTTTGKNADYTTGNNNYRTDDAKGVVYLENGTATAPANIGWLRSGDWFNYTFNCTEAGLYKVTVHAREWQANSSVRLSFDGNSTSTLYMEDNGQEEDVTRYVYLTKGDHAMKVEVFGDVNLFNYKFEKASDYSGYGSATVPGRVEAEDFNPGTAYHQDQNNTTEYYNRKAEHTYISNNNSPSNGYGLGYSTVGDSYDYTFTANEAGVYTIDFYTRGTNSGSLEVTLDGKTYSVNIAATGAWTDWTKTGILEGVKLTAGQHTISLKYGLGLDMDYMNFTKTADLSTSAITESLYDNTWNDVTANHCEVVFTGDDDSSNWRAYRDAAQKGWRYLLTKDIYENSSADDEYDEQLNYDVCHQAHADVRMHRVLTAESWDSMVLPFAVMAGTDKSNDEQETTVRTEGNHINYAAIYFAGSKDLLKFLNVGGHNTTGGEVYGAENYVLPAGTPFVIRVGSTTADNIYKFVNVETIASPEIQPKEIDGSYTFKGTFNAKTKYSVEAIGGVWAFSGSKIVHATKTARFKGYRGWFEDPDYSTEAPSFLSMAFEDQDNTTSGIDQVETIETSDAAYTLSGQRTTQMQKGIYIINGKKVVIK